MEIHSSLACVDPDSVVTPPLQLTEENSDPTRRNASGDHAHEASHRGRFRVRHWLGALTMLLLGGGCAPNSISLSIQSNLVPIPAGTNLPCTALPNPQSTFRNDGLVDLSIRKSFLMYPLYRNELISSENRSIGRPETRGIIIEGAKVDIRATTPTGDAADLQGEMTQFTVFSTGYVPAATASGPGYGTGTLEIIPSNVGNALFNVVCAPVAPVAPCQVPTYQNNGVRVLAVVTPFGRTMGGVPITGSPFNMPINFCCRCLMQFPADADDTTRMGPDCTKGTATTSACNPGQDDPVDCRACPGGSVAICQPTGYGCI